MTPPTGTAFEERFATLMAEQADLRLGPQRPAPPFDPGAPETTTDEARWRRFLPLIAAVVVLVLGLGVFLLVAHSRRATIPAVTVPDSRIQVLDARISVPEGWIIRPATDFDTTYYFGSEEHTFCVMPQADSANRDWQVCPVWIGQFDQGELQALALPDSPVILFQDQNTCDYVKAPTLKAEVRDFGGREAEWRSWSFPCSTTKPAYFENYVVETGPDWIMSTMKDSDAARQAMAYIASHSQLPAQTTKLRYHDQGVVTAVTSTGGTTTISMDRVYGLESLGKIIKTEINISYPMQTSVYTEALQGRAVKVGDRVSLDTDGSAVIWLEVGTQ